MREHPVKSTRQAGLRAPGSGPAVPATATRPRMRLWDRSRLLLGLAVAYAVLTWKVMADFPGIVPYGEAMLVIARQHQWIFWLLGAEAVRQAHFLVSEVSPGYHRFWAGRVSGGVERWSHRRFDDWARFRFARLLMAAFWVALAALVLGAVLGTSPFLAVFQAAALVLAALPSVLRAVLVACAVVVPVAGALWLLSRGGVETYFPGDVETRLADVWGQDHVVERVREAVVFLERPGEIEERGGYVPGGLLLWGPPGTGKTLLAEAVAGETGKPYVLVEPGAFANLLPGVGVLKMKALFRRLRRLALRHGGVVVHFDEADALGRRGRPAHQGAGGPAPCHGMTYLSEESRMALAFRDPGNGLLATGRAAHGEPGTLQALLAELSGLKKPRGLFNRLVRRALGMRPKPPPGYRVLVMMATSRPDAVDEALLRPGRIDRVYKVGHPTRAGRVATYQGYFGKVAHRLTAEQIDRLATLTPYATGATIKDLVNESLIAAVRAGRDVITWADVLHAKRLKQLGPPGGAEYAGRERHAVAVHEACHAVVAYVARFHLEIDVATIEKGADHLGLVASIEPGDQFTRWKSEYEADIMVALASLAGERMFFGEDSSSGVAGDLHAATFLAALMESHWGMGSGVTSLPALRELEITGGKAHRRGSRRSARARPGPAPDVLGERIEDHLVRLLEKTERLLEERRRDVLSLAHALEAHRTLNGDDVVAVIERAAGPLVDGAVYASDDFYRELEDYHREAVRAHREHGRIGRDLPGASAPPEEVIEPRTIVPPAAAVPPDDGPGVVAVAGAQGSRPEFVPWAAEPAPAYEPVPARGAAPFSAPVPASGVGRRWWLAGGSLLALVTVAVVCGLAVSGALAGSAGAEPGGGIVSPGLLAVLFLVVVAAVVGAGLAAVAVRGLRAAQAKAERERDQAHARAQLLAAALDPDTAMRLLGYDGQARREGA